MSGNKMTNGMLSNTRAGTLRKCSNSKILNFFHSYIVFVGVNTSRRHHLITLTITISLLLAYGKSSFFLEVQHNFSPFSFYMHDFVVNFLLVCVNYSGLLYCSW